MGHGADSGSLDLLEVTLKSRTPAVARSMELPAETAELWPPLWLPAAAAEMASVKGTALQFDVAGDISGVARGDRCPDCSELASPNAICLHQSCECSECSEPGPSASAGAVASLMLPMLVRVGRPKEQNRK